MTEYESASNCCPNCNHTFRTLADEWGTHPCPRCGFGYQDERLDGEKPYCPECDCDCEECECEEEQECRN